MGKIFTYDVPKMIPQYMLREGEKIVFEKHPHKLYTLLGPWIVGITNILLGIIFYASFLVTLILIMIGFLAILVPYLKWRYTIYALTTDRVMRLSGIIGKDFYENSLERIQDIRMKMSIMQRIFGCGDIMVTTAGTAGVECIWKNIPNPQEVLRTLRILLDERKSQKQI